MHHELKNTQTLLTIAEVAQYHEMNMKNAGSSLFPVIMCIYNYHKDSNILDILVLQNRNKRVYNSNIIDIFGAHKNHISLATGKNIKQKFNLKSSVFGLSLLLSSTLVKVFIVNGGENSETVSDIEHQLSCIDSLSYEKVLLFRNSQNEKIVSDWVEFL